MLINVSAQINLEKIDYKISSTTQNNDYYEIVNQKRADFITVKETRDLTLAERKAKKQFERWAYNWKNKVNVDGTFPNENQGYFNAGIIDDNGKLVIQNSKNRGVLSNESWVNIGPEQSELNHNGYSNFIVQMGRLNTLLRIKHPTNTNQDVLFVGAPDGGIWKSTDGGSTWSPKLDIVAGIGVTDIKTVPGTTTANYISRPIYVTTGDYDGANIKSIGVLKSTDGGETFISTGLSFNLTEQRKLGDLIVIDANTVFVGDDGNISKTIDGGTTWTTAYSTGDTGLGIGRAARNGNEIMYTGTYGDLYYTSDYTNDSNWVEIFEPANDLNKMAVTVDDNGDFYIQTMDGQIEKFNKTNNTFTFLGIIPAGYHSQQGFNQTLIVTNDIIITGEVNGHSSTNNASNWTKTLNGYWSNATSPGTSIHPDHHRMGRLDGTLNFWSVHDGGLSYINFSSTADITPNITYKSSKVKVTQSYSVAINPSANDDAIIMANQDNDAFSKRNGTWYAVALGDGVQGAINYTNSDIRYAGNQSGNILKTTTGFQGQVNGNGNTVQIPGANFYYPFEMHKTNPNIIYGGGNEVYKLNGSSGLSIASTNSGLIGTIRSIATHGNSVIAATDSDIKFSSNQASTWSVITSPSGASSDITSLDYDATNNQIIYVSYSSYVAGNKIYKTTDGGSNWSNISGDLPNIIVNEIILKQNQTTEYLFIATELGVYYTTNGGTNWTKLGQGMPNVKVTDIDIHYTGDKLIASTFGRGLWSISIANSTLSLSETSFENKPKIFPNPVINNELNITLPNDVTLANYMIYNVVGGIVSKGKLNNTENTIKLNNLSNGLFIIKISSGNKASTQKIIIK